MTANTDKIPADIECPRCEDIFPEDEAGDAGECPTCTKRADWAIERMKENGFRVVFWKP